MSREKFINEQNKFNEEFGINFSVEDYQADRKRMKYFDEFVIDTDHRNRPVDEYVDTLAAALKEYFENRTKLQDGKNYDTSDISISRFIDGFEKVMQAKYESTVKEGDNPRRPYEGAKYDKLAKFALKSVSNYDKSLNTVWADNILNKKISLEQMMTFTDRAIQKVDNARPDDLGEAMHDLENVVRARRSIEKVRNQRGKWWKRMPWNWSRNSREKKYMQSLNDTIARWSASGYPIGKPLKFHMLKDATKELQDRIDAYTKLPKAEKEKEIQPIKAPQSKEPTNEEKSRTLAEDPAMKEKMTKQFLKNIGKSNIKNKLPDKMIDMFISNMYDRAKDGALGMWSAIKSNDLKGNEDKLSTASKEMFEAVHSDLYPFKLDTDQRLIAAQKITDLMINTFSPVAFNKYYEKYGDCHYLSTCNVDQIATLGLTDVESAKYDLKWAQDTLNEEKRMKFDLSDTFNKNENKSEKSPKIDPPSTNKEKNISK